MWREGAARELEDMRSRDQMYWDKRYQEGGNSGSGSRGRLASFKVSVVNEIIRRESVSSLLDHGAGDGEICSQLKVDKLWMTDVSRTARARLRNKKIGKVVHPQLLPLLRTDIVISLDVTYHITHDELFERYMVDATSVGRRFILIYSRAQENSIREPRHIRSNDFLSWMARNEEWSLHEQIDNPFSYKQKDSHNTSKSNFYLFKRNT